MKLNVCVNVFFAHPSSCSYLSKKTWLDVIHTNTKYSVVPVFCNVCVHESTAWFSIAGQSETSPLGFRKLC